MLSIEHINFFLCLKVKTNVNLSYYIRVINKYLKSQLVKEGINAKKPLVFNITLESLKF